MYSRLVALCLALGLVATIVFSLVQSISKPQPKPEPFRNAGVDLLRVRSKDLTFGTIWVDSKLQHRVVIENISHQLVSIKEFRSSCSCTKIEPESFDLHPGNKRDLLVTFDFAQNGREANSAHERQFSASILPLGNVGPLIREPWHITGTLRSPFRLSSHRIDFGEGEIINGERFPEKRIRVIAFPGFEYVDCRVTHDDRSAVESMVKATDRDGLIDIIVRPRENLPEGQFNSMIYITAIDPEGNEFAKMPLEVSGAVSSEIAAFPAMLHLGSIVVGTTVKDRVVFSSWLGAAVQMVKAECRAKEVEVHPIKDQPTKEAVLEIAVRPISSGEFHETIDLQFSSESGELIGPRSYKVSYVATGM